MSLSAIKAQYGTQMAGVERTDEAVSHDAPLRLFAELRDQGKARQGKARQGKAMQCNARQGKARQGKARQCNARQGKARQGKAKLNGVCLVM